MKVLITGIAGFIGSSLAKKLLERGDQVVGIDNMNDYYSVALKRARLKHIGNAITFHQIDIANKEKLNAVFANEHFDVVCNLAAQAGVRYSITNPDAYINSNIVGFANILECCRNHGVNRLIFASNSSVYGGNPKVPFSEEDKVDHPVSLYAATKKAMN